MKVRDEQSLRQWARDNYAVGDPIEPYWHPVIADECAKMNQEVVDRRRMKEVVSSVEDLESEFKGCIALRFGFRGSIRESQSITRAEAEKLLEGMPAERKAAVLKEFKGQKRLLPKEGFREWENLKAQRGAWTKSVKNYGIPFAVDGMTVVKIERIPEIEELLDVIEATHDMLVTELLAAYPKAISKESVQSELYAAADYPTVERLGATFKVTRQWAHFGVPEVLREIDPVRWEAERKRTAEMWNEIKANGVLALRKMVLEITTRLVESVKPDPKTGEKKRFYATAVSNLTDFFETFEARNIVNDAELAERVSTLKALIEGKDLEQFKTDDSVRKQVLEKGGEIARELETMVVSASARAITFED